MRNIKMNLHYSAQGIAFISMTFSFFLPVGVLLAQAASATISSAPSQFSATNGYGSPGEPNVSQFDRKDACAMLCSRISRGEEGLNISCKFTFIRPTAGPLTFLRSLDPSELAGAGSRNNSWCCRCEVGVARFALLTWKKGPPYSNNSLKPGPVVCVDLPRFPFLRLMCSVSPPSAESKLPAQPRVLNCNQPAVLRPPPLRTRYDVERWIRHYVENYKVVVFAKSACSYCSAALDALKSFASGVCTIMIDHSPLMSAFQDVLERRTGARTVPRVFIGGKFVGGCDDVLGLVDANLLQGILKEAGAV